jgi:hypothetical protein
MAIEIKGWINEPRELEVYDLYDLLKRAKEKNWYFTFLEAGRGYDDSLVWYTGEGPDSEVERVYEKMWNPEDGAGPSDNSI